MHQEKCHLHSGICFLQGEFVTAYGTRNDRKDAAGKEEDQKMLRLMNPGSIVAMSIIGKKATNQRNFCLILYRKNMTY
jgi:hypothetical protein